MAASILVVDDEPRILDVVRRYLERDGFVVHGAQDGREALDRFAAVRPVLVVLDLMMPNVDGWQVCKELRRTSNVPILMLTARADESDTLLGLDLGADDYMTKPFSPRELVARVRALLRRAGAAPSPQEPARIEAGALAIDVARHETTWDGAPIALSPAEFRLLEVLARERGRVLNRAQLVDLALGDEFDGYDRTVDAHIKNLRRKLREGGAGDPIETVRGIGYRFVEHSAERPTEAGASIAAAGGER